MRSWYTMAGKEAPTPRTSMLAAVASATFDCNDDDAVCSIKARGRQASIPVASKVFLRIIFQCCSWDCDDQVLHVLGWRIAALHVLIRMVVLPAIDI